MNTRTKAVYGRQSVDKKDSISIESQIEFCLYELKGEVTGSTPTKDFPARTQTGRSFRS